MTSNGIFFDVGHMPLHRLTPRQLRILDYELGNLRKNDDWKIKLQTLLLLSANGPEILLDGLQSSPESDQSGC